MSKEEEFKKPVRLNTRISADTNEWLDRKAYEMGLTKSALVNFAIESYKKEIEAVNAMPSIVRELEKMGLK